MGEEPSQRRFRRLRVDRHPSYSAVARLPRVTGTSLGLGRIGNKSVRARERCTVGTSLATRQVWAFPHDRAITSDASNPPAVMTGDVGLVDSESAVSPLSSATSTVRANVGTGLRNAALVAVERTEEGLRLYWRPAPRPVTVVARLRSYPALYTLLGRTHRTGADLHASVKGAGRPSTGLSCRSCSTPRSIP